MTNTKLQSCHCEERSDVAIYRIEPALVRVAGNRLLALQYFGNGSLKNQAWQIRSGPGIASHSFAMTFINSSRLYATWYESSCARFKRPA